MPPLLLHEFNHLFPSPQLEKAPSLCPTSFASAPEPRSFHPSASSLLPLSPSSTVPPHPELDQKSRSGALRGFPLRASPSPTRSSYLSSPPTRPSKAPWSRPSATTCTSSPQSWSRRSRLFYVTLLKRNVHFFLCLFFMTKTDDEAAPDMCSDSLVCSILF